MELDLVGTNGALRAAYHTAVIFGAWRLQTIGPRLYRVNCHVLHTNAAWLSYRPLVMRLKLTSGIMWSFTMEGEPAIVVEDGERMGTFFVSGDPEPVQGG